MLKDLIKTRDRVHHLLEKYPKTRDSDKELWLAYNCIFNDLKEIISNGDYSVFRRWIIDQDTPAFESLSRARRKVQEEHHHLAGQKDIRLEEAGLVRDWSQE